MCQVWVGPLSDGRIVVVLWNRNSSKGTVTAYWSDVGLQQDIAVDARDLWAVRYFNTCYVVPKK